MPEEQAYILAWSLSEAAFPGCSQGRAMNASLEMMGVNPKDLVIERDTFVINSSGIGATCKNYATNVAYIPTNGRLKARQPMLRYVRDETRAGKNRENPTEAYKYNYFYTKYIGDVDVFMFNSTNGHTLESSWCLPTVGASHAGPATTISASGFLLIPMP